MAIKIVTSWETLMMKAKKLGEAKQRGDPKEIEDAQIDHDAYRDMCLKSDKMVLPFTRRELSGR